MATATSSGQRRGTAADDFACAGDLMDVMPKVMGALRAAVRQHVGVRLSVPQFRCLNFIGRQPGSSVTALADFMGTSLPTASANADRLVRAGLAQAQVSDADRRRSELRVTASGAQLLADMRQRARQELASVLTAVPPDDVRLARGGLSVLRKAFVPAADNAGTQAGPAR